MEAPYGVCGEPGLNRHRFTFAGRVAHLECAVEDLQWGSDSGDDRLGVAIREGDRSPCRRTFRLIEILPRTYQIYDGATEWGARRRGQLSRSWRSAISEREEAANKNENKTGDGMAREGEKIVCTYCRLSLEKSARESRDSHMQVPILWPHGESVHVSCMLERADRLTRGQIVPRSCVTHLRVGRGEVTPSPGGAC